MVINEFLAKLGSVSPVPGGGAAAGYCLALGASSAEKAARFSEFDGVDEFIKEFVRIRNAGAQLAEKDQQVFLEWQNARSLPKESNDEKMLRSQKIESSVLLCIETPYELCLESEKLIKKIDCFAPQCSKWLESDAAVGASLAGAAFESGIYNILINLPYLKDISLKEKFEHYINSEVIPFHDIKSRLTEYFFKRLKN